MATRHADRLPLAAYLDDIRETAGPACAAATEVVSAIAGAGRTIARVVALGPLGRETGDPTLETDLAGTIHQDAHRILAEALQNSPVAIVNAEEVVVLDPQAPIAVAVDPLHASANIDANAAVGTIFSIVPYTSADGFGPGTMQIAAGFILYGAQTVMALTFGDGTHRFILDPTTSDFVRALVPARIDEQAREFSIDISKRRYWDAWLRRYVQECELGSSGPRQRNLNLRWLESLVGEAWRILERGGVWICPADHRPGFGSGAIRLCHEASPIAFLIEQAGGAATNGGKRLLEIVPVGPQDHVPFVFGSKREVEHIARCQKNAEKPQHNPLFGIRGLFR